MGMSRVVVKKSGPLRPFPPEKLSLSTTPLLAPMLSAGGDSAMRFCAR
jgi:hypothetical protein